MGLIVDINVPRLCKIFTIRNGEMPVNHEYINYCWVPTSFAPGVVVTYRRVGPGTSSDRLQAHYVEYRVWFGAVHRWGFNELESVSIDAELMPGSHLDVFGYDNCTESVNGMPSFNTHKIGQRDTTPKALVWVDRTMGWVKCRTTYNKEFLQILKAKIPASKRRWIKDEKVWAVHFNFAEELINIAANYYEVIELSSDPDQIARGDTEKAKKVKLLAKKISRKAESVVTPDTSQRRRIKISGDDGDDGE